MGRLKFDFFSIQRHTLNMKIKFLAFPLIFLSLSVNADSYRLIKNEGDTLKERINPPVDFERTAVEKDSFAEYLRNYPLKSAESPVLLYDGQKKLNQDAHTAVFVLPLQNNEFQNASGSIIRLYAEFMRKARLDQKISFHFTNGSVSKWTDWLEKSTVKRETRLDFAGNLKKWTKYEKSANEQELFDSYLKNVLANTDILSVQTYESEPVSFENLKIGDVLWDLGKPAHLCLVVDLCKNPETGEKALLLAQGNSPAQEFHVIKNPRHESNPWYYESDFILPLRTPEHLFPKDSWRHLKYLD